MSLYCWLLLLPSLYRYVLCTADPCGEMKHVVGQESGDVLLRVDQPGVTEISWVLRNTLIALTKPHESVEVKPRQFKNRLYNGTNGSLNITKLTRDDQGEFAANIRLDKDEECNQIYNLTIYSKLLDGDIRIYHNVTHYSEICNVTLICAVDKKDVSISWNDSVTNTVMKTSTIQVADPDTNSSWTCTVSHPVASISRTVIPLDFCQNESKWKIIIIAVFTCLSLLAIIACICYLWKKHNYIWKRKKKLTSTNEDPQQTEHVYWDIDQSKACSKTEATARKGNLNIDPVYMTSLRVSGKSAYNRGDLLQGDDSVQMYCD
ncbi:SLAM family member 9-like [Lithobates pipiens]